MRSVTGNMGRADAYLATHWCREAIRNRRAPTTPYYVPLWSEPTLDRCDRLSRSAVSMLAHGLWESCRAIAWLLSSCCVRRPRSGKPCAMHKQARWQRA